MNEITISIYIFMCSIAMGLIIFSLVYREDFARIITSFIAMIVSYINSLVILNGNVVVYQATGTTYSTIPIQATYLNYFWLFIAILSGLLFILFVASLINTNMQESLDEQQSEAERDY